MGININFSDRSTDDLRDSIDLATAIPGDGVDELDVRNLESDADDLS